MGAPHKLLAPRRRWYVVILMTMAATAIHQALAGPEPAQCEPRPEWLVQDLEAPASELTQTLRKRLERDTREQAARLTERLEGEIDQKSKQIDVLAIESSKRQVRIDDWTKSVSEDPELLGLKSQVADLDREVAQASLEIVNLKLAQRNPGPDIIARVPEAPEVVRMRSELADLQAEAVDLTLRFTEIHPLVSRKKGQVEELSHELSAMAMEDLTRRRNQAILDLQASIQQACILRDARTARREELLEDMKRRLAELRPEDLAKAREELFHLQQRLAEAQGERAALLSRMSGIALWQETRCALVDIVAEAKEARPAPRGGGTSWAWVWLVGALVGIGSATALGVAEWALARARVRRESGGRVARGVLA